MTTSANMVYSIETLNGNGINNEKNLTKLMRAVNESKMYEYVKTIAAFGPHPTGSDALDQVNDFIFSQFESFGVSVMYDSWTFDGVSGENIIATIPGASDKTVILTAHSDTIDISPGADDDGSGIASILMISEILSEYQFDLTIKFMIFTGEEIGLYGSRDYARRAIDRGDDILGVLSLDKIGYAQLSEDGMKIRHHAGPSSDWMIELSKEIADEYDDEIGLEVIGFPFDASSDHKAFVDVGYPGSNLVEESLNPFYHTSKDCIDFINSSYLGKVTRLALGITCRLTELKPVLDDTDINIFVGGSIQSKPSVLKVVIENKRYQDDTANVSISIQMRHLLRDSYVCSIKEFYTEPCCWNLTEEIFSTWEFNIGPRVFSTGFFTIHILLRGVKDDVSLFKEAKAVGVILYPCSFLLMPL